ncbi:hypothetical protein P8452_08720 [Trifolium repens]|nr:hypothetical protein P8452_08720 [Trifolium repens]
MSIEIEFSGDIAISDQGVVLFGVDLDSDRVGVPPRFGEAARLSLFCCFHGIQLVLFRPGDFWCCDGGGEVLAAIGVEMGGWRISLPSSLPRLRRCSCLCGGCAVGRVSASWVELRVGGRIWCSEERRKKAGVMSLSLLLYSFLFPVKKFEKLFSNSATNHQSMQVLSFPQTHGDGKEQRSRAHDCSDDIVDHVFEEKQVYLVSTSSKESCLNSRFLSQLCNRFMGAKICRRTKSVDNNVNGRV